MLCYGSFKKEEKKILSLKEALKEAFVHTVIAQYPITHPMPVSSMISRRKRYVVMCSTSFKNLKSTSSYSAHNLLSYIEISTFLSFLFSLTV